MKQENEEILQGTDVSTGTDWTPVRIVSVHSSLASPSRVLKQ